jgi:hypothetical protein
MSPGKVIVITRSAYRRAAQAAAHMALKYKGKKIAEDK